MGKGMLRLIIERLVGLGYDKIILLRVLGFYFEGNGELVKSFK